MVRALIAAVAVCAAAGLFLAGRASATSGVSTAAAITRESAAYERGLGDGVADGQELQATLSLRGDARRRARAVYRDGYAAGANDVFGGFDGGWRFATPYVVSLARGPGTATYRIASRALAPAGCRVP
jgi:hypothetical protein